MKITRLQLEQEVLLAMLPKYVQKLILGYELRTFYFELLESARKLALTAAEQMQYMVTGVRPAPSPRSASVVPLPAAVAARSNASVASTRARVMAVIDERERVVAELHSLLPFPRDEAERTAATRSLLVDPAAAAALREWLRLQCNGHVTM